MANGRGAWSTTGKDNGARLYEYIPGKAKDGSTPTKSSAHQAVNLGVKAIQVQLNAQSVARVLHADGIYGSATAAAVKAFQKANGLIENGVAGAITCALLWHDLITAASSKYPSVPAEILYGQMMHESTADPGACGYYHEPDRGLVQINTEIEPVSTKQAHDPEFALVYSARRFDTALTKYAGPNQLNCAILAHNSPAGADALFRTGKYTNSTHENYVNAVLAEAEEWAASGSNRAPRD